MQVNDSGFKVNTVREGESSPPPEDVGGAPPAGQTEEDQLLEESIRDYFTGPEATGADSAPPEHQANPLGDYTMGEIQNGEVNENPYRADTVAWLTNFPPTIEELRERLGSKVDNYLDRVKQRYEKAKEDLVALREQIMNGTADVSQLEARELNDYLTLIDAALGRCNVELGKIPQMLTLAQANFLEELRTFTDINGDGWVGRPHFAGSYGVVRNSDGTFTYIDPANGRAVPRPVMDPDYSWAIATDNSLAVVQGGEAVNYNGELHQDENGRWVGNDGEVDLFLQVTTNAFENAANHTMNASLDISAPEYIWVRRDADATLEEPYLIKDGKMVLADDGWDTAGGIRQKVPQDISEFAQVQVTKMVVRSVDSGLHEQGHPNYKLFHHYIELYHGEQLITRIRIEGFSGNAGSVGADTNRGVSYVAASSVSLAINGNQRVNPIELQAGGFVSTGRHVVDNLTNKLRIDPSSEQSNQMAYKENIEAFTEKNNHKRKVYDYTVDAQGNDQGVPDTWTEEGQDHRWGGYSDTNRDRYVKYEEVERFRNNPRDTLLEERTGIFVDGLRGSLTLTDYNDIVNSPGVDEIDDTRYAREHLPANHEDIDKGDAYYSNIIRAQGGNDIVRAGKGDNFITGVEFAWVEASSRDTNYIVTPKIVRTNEGSKFEDAKKNAKVFVNVTNGEQTYVFNPVEEDQAQLSRLREADMDDADNLAGAMRDDYFHVSSSRKVYANPADPDVGRGLNESQDNSSLESFDPAGLESTISEFEQAIIDELTRRPEVDDAVVEASWEDVMGQATELDAEMDDFFNQMFGGPEGAFADMETQVEPL